MEALQAELDGLRRSRSQRWAPYYRKQREYFDYLYKRDMDAWYVLDPVIRLQRIRGTEHGRVAVLVDEAHQLAERARDMLTVELDRAALRRARQRAPEAIARRLRSVERAIRDVARPPVAEPDTQAATASIDVPAALLRALERLLRALAEDGVDFDQADETCRRAVFDCLRFLFAADWFTAEDFCYLLHRQGSDCRIEMLCLAPGAHIDATFAEFHGVVRFSGTVSPLWLFQQLHGRGDDPATARTRNDFPAERLGVYLVPDVATFYRERQRSLPALVRLVVAVLDAAPGNYLVALPSFEYVDLLRDAIAGVAVRAQRRDMTLDERDAFIRWMAETDAPRVGLVVMGGLFAESVDFDRDALAGVIVVTVGLPPPATSRNLIAARYGDFGEQVAYRQPAMTRVIQAAGRVVRGRDDAGIVVLVDPRFAQAEFQAFFPAHWQPRLVRCHEVGSHVAIFREALRKPE